MTRQVSAWQRGHPLSWAQRSWGPSIVLSARSLYSSSLPPSLSLSQSSPESPSSSLPLLPSPSVSFAHSVAPYLRAIPPPSLSSFSPFLPELSATGSSSVRRSIGILHPVPPLTRWRRTKVLTLMFHSRCCLLSTIRTHVYAARRWYGRQRREFRTKNEKNYVEMRGDVTRVIRAACRIKFCLSVKFREYHRASFSVGCKSLARYFNKLVNDLEARLHMAPS